MKRTLLLLAAAGLAATLTHTAVVAAARRVVHGPRVPAWAAPVAGDALTSHTAVSTADTPR